jgi:hypothetical protein
MATPYVKSITAAEMKINFEKMQNISDKEILYSIFDTINTEYAAMETAGLAGYTVTTGLQATLEQKCERMANSVQVEILKSFFVVLLAEYLSVETLGLSYVQTDNSATDGAFGIFEAYLRIAVENICEVENRTMLNTFISQIIVEHLILVAAEA